MPLLPPYMSNLITPYKCLLQRKREEEVKQKETERRAKSSPRCGQGKMQSENRCWPWQVNNQDPKISPHEHRNSLTHNCINCIWIGNPQLLYGSHQVFIGPGQGTSKPPTMAAFVYDASSLIKSYNRPPYAREPILDSRAIVVDRFRTCELYK